MSRVDVRDLAKEKLAPGQFPAQARSDFRLYLAPEVRRGIEQHAKADTSVEICGVLVGNWGTDENGPYAVVTDHIRCENAASKFAEVTFTHESWAQINKEMDSRFADSRIVGWYHSHPDFGIFLSERDTFIQENFFSSPGQVAYVIDPVRDLEGVFAWRDGKPKPLPYFWIGSDIRTVEASERSSSNGMGTPSALSGASSAMQPAQRAAESSSLGFMMMVLGALAAFAIGYLYGGWRSRWEQQMIIQGAVANFVDTNLIQQGLEQELAGVRARLIAVANELKNMPAPGGKLSDKDREAAEKRRSIIDDNLLFSESELARIERTYGLSEEERAIIVRYAQLKEAEIRRALEPNETSAGKAAPSKKPAAKAPANTAKPAEKGAAAAPRQPPNTSSPNSQTPPGSKEKK